MIQQIAMNTDRFKKHDELKEVVGSLFVCKVKNFKNNKIKYFSRDDMYNIYILIYYLFIKGSCLEREELLIKSRVVEFN